MYMHTCSVVWSTETAYFLLPTFNFLSPGNLIKDTGHSVVAKYLVPNSVEWVTLPASQFSCHGLTLFNTHFLSCGVNYDVIGNISVYRILGF